VESQKPYLIGQKMFGAQRPCGPIIGLSQPHHHDNFNFTTCTKSFSRIVKRRVFQGNDIQVVYIPTPSMQCSIPEHDSLEAKYGKRDTNQLNRLSLLKLRKCRYSKTHRRVNTQPKLPRILYTIVALEGTTSDPFPLVKHDISLLVL
jgi:hypothetical protein